jgi:hypothetical protein
MAAKEWLAKATVVFHSCIKRAIHHQQLRQVAPFTSELSRKYEKGLQTFPQKAWMQFEFSPMRWLKNTRDHMKL